MIQPSQLQSLFGNIDIYLFDQLLKGRIKEGMQVLDAGCGNGRNSRYLIEAGLYLYGADSSVQAIKQIRGLARELAPALPEENFVVADLAKLPYPDQYFDVVICSAVLHFASSEEHFRAIVHELWRTLKPGGMLFCRFSTTIGLENFLQHQQERFYLMPHGATWFLADEALLTALEQQLNAFRLEPLKTVLVERQRSMSTWVLQK